MSKRRFGDRNSNWKGGLREKSCAHCGSAFSVKPCRDGSARYCSLACFNNMQRVNRVDWVAVRRKTRERVARQEKLCRTCGSPFLVPPGLLGVRHFCCKPCGVRWRKDFASGSRNPNWRGGKRLEPYPFNWRAISSLVIKRDGGACVRCGSTRAVQAHHIDYDKTNCADANLIALCAKCHGMTNFGRGEWCAHFRDIQAKRGLDTSAIHEPRMARLAGWNRGEKHPLAKLTQANVDEIRVLIARRTQKRKDIAERFGVSQATIGNIANGKNWLVKHVRGTWSVERVEK